MDQGKALQKTVLHHLTVNPVPINYMYQYYLILASAYKIMYKIGICIITTHIGHITAFQNNIQYLKGTDRVLSLLLHSEKKKHGFRIRKDLKGLICEFDTGGG